MVPGWSGISFLRVGMFRTVDTDLIIRYKDNYVEHCRVKNFMTASSSTYQHEAQVMEVYQCCSNCINIPEDVRKEGEHSASPR